MSVFVKNAIMLYKVGGPHVIEGIEVDYKVFDRDSVDFETESDGWVTFEELMAGEPVTGEDKPRRGRPPKSV